MSMASIRVRGPLPHMGQANNPSDARFIAQIMQMHTCPHARNAAGAVTSSKQMTHSLPLRTSMIAGIGSTSSSSSRLMAVARDVPRAEDAGMRVRVGLSLAARAKHIQASTIRHQHHGRHARSSTLSDGQTTHLYDQLS